MLAPAEATRQNKFDSIHLNWTLVVPCQFEPKLQFKNEVTRAEKSNLSLPFLGDLSASFKFTFITVFFGKALDTTRARSATLACASEHL